MLTDDELAALEWVAEQLWAFDDEDEAHIATLRRMIEREASERADVVAWLRAGEIGGVDNNAARKIADAIESGAHVGATKGGDDE
jgi:hypothetical protein